DDADSQQRDGADLEEGREIIARCQQQPHREHGGDEAICDDDECERLALKVEIGGERRSLGYGPSVAHWPQEPCGCQSRDHWPIVRASPETGAPASRATCCKAAQAAVATRPAPAR